MSECRSFFSYKLFALVFDVHFATIIVTVCAVLLNKRQKIHSIILRTSIRMFENFLKKLNIRIESRTPSVSGI